MAPFLTIGRALLSVSALNQSVASFVADWSPTHVFNPRWPPHARFHNGQTMTFSVILAISTLYYTFRTPLDDGSAITNPLVARESIRIATFLGSMYWVAAFTGILYPGAKAVDPEFGEGFPQAIPFGGSLAVAIVGGCLEMRRVGAEGLG
ncbi:MAG: hypothetical protein Q9191_005992, partial [Dirinaria sp. TL-2023a]